MAFARGWPVAVVLLAVAGCSAAPATAPPSSSSRASEQGTAASPTPSADPTCSAPSPAAAAPTDFPHPDVVVRPAAGPPSDADAALAQQGLGATTLAGPISQRAFQHYLDATGTYLDLPVDGLLTTRPALVRALNAQLAAAVTTALMTLQQATFASCQPQTFASEWTTFTDATRDDWYFTLGSFAYHVIGTVVPNAAACTQPGCVPPMTVTYQAAIGDTYNFDPGTTFARFGQLALDGHAADFLDGGLTTSRSAVVGSAAEISSLDFGG